MITACPGVQRLRRSRLTRRTEFAADETLATENMARLRLNTTGPPFTFLGNNPRNEDSNAFSQELRLTSSTDSRLQWVAGVYYLEESVDRDETAGLGAVVLDGAGGFMEINPDNPGRGGSAGAVRQHRCFRPGYLCLHRQASADGRDSVHPRQKEDKRSGDRWGTRHSGGLRGRIVEDLEREPHPKWRSISRPAKTSCYTA